jgi:hypothetical protein
MILIIYSFDECKNIQNSVLSKCGPVDYKCQCDAQVNINY